jgi:hypothetical protein
MSEKDLYGLKGLQARLDGAFGMDQAAIASGMDLNTLGLDLNRYWTIINLSASTYILTDQTHCAQTGPDHLLIREDVL